MSESEENDRSGRLPSRARMLLTVAAILVLPGCLGLMGSAALLSASRAGWLSRWRSLGAPPEAGVEIVTGDMGTIYVRAASGNIYGCREQGGREASDSCWRKASEPLSVDPDTRIGERLTEREVKPPRGEVVDALDATHWYADAAFEARYVLLDDGSVWKWQSGGSAYGDLGILLLGPLAGLAVSILLLVVRGTRAVSRSLRRHAQRDKSMDDGV